MDAGFAAFLGALAGAVGAGVPKVVSSFVERGNAKAQREHEATQSELQRQHEGALRDGERTSANRSARAQQIAYWRDGMNRSALAYQS